MSSAGQQLVAGRIPGELIASTMAITDSADFTTTELQILSLQAPLVEGRTYRVKANPGFSSSVTGDVVTARLYEDSTLGTNLDSTSVTVLFNTSFRKSVATLDARFTAIATGNKTFVVTGQREAGTGNCRREAATSRPCFLDVYYESG